MTTPGDWGQWSSCSLSCGGGVQIRNRTCLDPLPIFSEIDLMGKDTTETRKCIPFYSCPGSYSLLYIHYIYVIYRP